MSREPIYLETPLYAEDVKALKTGDVVRLYGVLYAARDAAHARMVEAIERGLRGMVGKGARSEEVLEAMRMHGCVYFGAVEGTAALLADCVKEAEVIAYPHLGTEAVRRLVVEDVPVVVINDLYGGDLYREGRERWRRPFV